MPMLKPARLNLFSYVFVGLSFLFWHRALIAYDNGLFFKNTNFDFVFNLVGASNNTPGPAEYRAPPLIPINEQSILYFLVSFSFFFAIAALYCCYKSYRSKQEVRWYSIPALLSVTMLFLAVRLGCWAY